MSGRLRRALEGCREELAGKAAARLVDELNADVGEELARLEAIDKVLKALPVPRWRTALGPTAMALVCLAAVGVLWIVTVDTLGIRTGIVLAVDAATVDLRVAGNWEWRDRLRLADGRVRIERAELTLSDPRQAFATLPDDAWLDVEAAVATLQGLRLEPGAELTLERVDGEALAVYATNGGAAGSLLVNGSVTLTWGEAGGAAPQTRTLRVDVPEEITFSSRRPRGAPTRLVFRPGVPLTLRHLAVTRLRFGREAAQMPGEPTFVSTIRGGQLRVPDVGESHDLSVGYGVLLIGLDGEIQRLRVDDREKDENVIAVDLEGTVKQVAVGPPGRERDVTPSVLAYLYHNQRLAFLFAAASFIWGALWSLRRLAGH